MGPWLQPGELESVLGTPKAWETQDRFPRLLVLPAVQPESDEMGFSEGPSFSLLHLLSIVVSAEQA